MRNFNGDELQKYEKMGKETMKKIKNKASFVPRVSYRSVFKSISLAMGAYFLYRLYDHWSYRRNNYIDIFSVKRAAVEKTKRMDFWRKMTTGFSDQKYANQMFLQNFSKGFQSIKTEIQSMQNLGDDVKIKQIILTEYRAPKLDLGFFQLHSRQSYMVISKKGDLVKKSYEIPVKLFGVPFGSKKKQATKKTVKKTRQSKMVETKTRLQLPLACKPINFLNTMMKEKEEQRKILFECRQKMEEEEKLFVEKIKQAVDFIPPYLQENSEGFSIPKM